MTEAIKSFRGEMKKSRFKIWLRAALFVIFGILFTVYFVRDIAHGYFNWGWTVLLCALFIPVGFLLSRIVPMQADLESKAVTLSLDRFYLILIWVLVIAKLIASIFHRWSRFQMSSCAPFLASCSEGWEALGYEYDNSSYNMDL